MLFHQDSHEEEVATSYVEVQVQSGCQLMPQLHTDVQYSEVSHEKNTVSISHTCALNHYSSDAETVWNATEGQSSLLSLG